jgi:excisionase family DNA binding protein
MLKPKTAAERLGLSLSKVYALLQTGDLAHYRIDGSILIDESHLKDFLAAHEQRGRKTDPDQGKPVPRPRLRYLDL